MATERQLVISGMAIMMIAIVHVLYPRVEKAASAYRHVWIPFTGGVAIGYVFLYLLPKLSDYTAAIRVDGIQGVWEILDYRVYLYCLVGFTFYYFVDQYKDTEDDNPVKPVILKGGGFFIYNVLTGYVLANWSRPGIIPVFLGGGVLTMHLLGVNYQVREWNNRIFDDYFRWLFAVAIIIGWGAGAFLAIPRELEMVVTGVLAGGIITNIMIEEIPSRQPGKTRPFLGGVALIVLVTAFLRSLPRMVQ